MPSAAGTDGGEADLSPPVLSLPTIGLWLIAAAVTYGGCVGIGMALGWLIEAALYAGWGPL